MGWDYLVGVIIAFIGSLYVVKVLKDKICEQENMINSLLDENAMLQDELKKKALAQVVAKRAWSASLDEWKDWLDERHGECAEGVLND